MSESIKGSSSSLYIKDEVPNVTNSADTMNHLSVQNLWGARGAADVLVHGLYRHNAVAVPIEVGSVKRKIKITGHGAIAGDFLKMDNGSADGEEVAILKVIDADFFIIAKEINAAIGDNCFIMKPVTPKYAKDGSIAVSQGPVQYVLNSVDTEVAMDTAVSANIKALPTELIFKKDGANTRVSYDTTTPTNSEAIPVNIVTVNGTGVSTTVDLTGAQVNVQLSHTGTSPDSVQLGKDGVGIVDVHDDTTNKHLRTYDSILASLIGLKTDIKAAEPIGATAESVISLLKKLAAVLPIDRGLQDEIDSLSVNLSTEQKALIGEVNEVAPLTDIANSGLNGRLQRVAQNLTSIMDLLPSVIGQNNMADSLSVTIATDQSNLPIDGVVSLTGVAKGATVASEATVTQFDADHNALDVIVRDFDSSLKVVGGAFKQQEVSADGLTPFASQAINRTAQKAISTIGVDFLTKAVTSITMGFDGDEHREISLDSTGKINVVASQATASNLKAETTPASVSAGSITHTQLSVGTSAVRATVSGSAPSARKKLLIKPSKGNSGAIFLGSSSVTTANGLEIIGPDRLEFLNENNDYYLISDTAGQVVEILEVY